MAQFQRIQLPYEFDALEPFVDAQTMQLHSEKHHQAYTDKLNLALEGSEWGEKPIEEILRNLDSLPEDIRTAVQNNGGGYVNHNLFFTMLKPNGGMPGEVVMKMITDAFGSFDEFKIKFTEAATTQFGSGWAWLALDENGQNPHISKLPNQDSPYMSNHLPLLGLDVWEHAYYLKYQNRRPEYIEAFWNIINWDKVEELYTNAGK